VTTPRIRRIVAAQRAAREEAGWAESKGSIACWERFYRGENPSRGDLVRCLTGGRFDPKEIFKDWLPGVVVRRARRQAGLPACHMDTSSFIVVAEYLSYDLYEVPTGAARAAVDDIMLQVIDISIPWEDRIWLGASLAFLGKNPEKTRRKLWASGKMERAAAKSICDPNSWHDGNIMDDWSVLASHLPHPQGVDEARTPISRSGLNDKWLWPNPGPSHQTVANIITSTMSSPTQAAARGAMTPTLERTGQNRPEPADDPGVQRS
jgi:hypothetical protein